MLLSKKSFTTKINIPLKTIIIVTFVSVFMISSISPIINAQTVKTQDFMQNNDGLFISLTPSRILDTREGNGAAKAPLGSGQTISVQITGKGGVPASNVRAVVMNVTAVNPSTNGHARVWPSDVAMPNASSLNYTAKQNIANSVTVPVGNDGKVKLYNAGGNTEYVMDVSGYYVSADAVDGAMQAGRFNALTPSRILDTREGNGAAKAPLGSGQTISVQITGKGGVPASNVRAVVMNVTAVNPSTNGHARVWPSDVAMPNASSLNYTAKQNIANSVTVPVGKDGKVKLYNAGGNTEYVMDVSGYYVDYEPGYNVIDLTRGFNENFGKLHEYTPVEFSATRLPQNDTWNLQYGTSILLDNSNRIHYSINYSSISKTLSLNVDGTNFSYCEPANCKILSNKITAQDNVATMNLSLKQNNLYKISFVYAKNKLGMPNGWVTVNLVDPSSTLASEPLFATKIANDNQNASMLEETHSQRITKTIKDDIGYSCDNVDPLIVSIPQVLDANSGAIKNTNCPGNASVKILNNSTIMSLGVAKAQRDSVKPVANINKYSNDFITISGSDNVALSNARVTIEPTGNSPAVTINNYPNNSISFPLNMKYSKFENKVIFTQDMQLQQGFTYKATIYLYDTSGNVQTKSLDFKY